MVAHDPKTKGLSLNEDLLKICQRIYQWKMFFNPDASKQDQEIFFICKKYIYAWNYFLYQFDNSQGEIKKANKSISIIKKLSPSFYHVLN